jgi:hypothetical protein
MAGYVRNLKNRDIINLLSRVKTAEAQYPADLLAQRRVTFMASVGALGGGGGLSSRGGSSDGHAGTALNGVTQMDKLIIAFEVIIITGLAAYLAATAYANRDYLEHLFFPGTPTAVRAVPTYLSGSAEPTASLIPTATGTPNPSETLEATPTSADENESTPQPASQPTDSGNHYGQTANPPNPHSPKHPPGH